MHCQQMHFEWVHLCVLFSANLACHLQTLLTMGSHHVSPQSIGCIEAPGALLAWVGKETSMLVDVAAEATAS